MDKFWQGHSSTTLRGRKQGELGPEEFFYQHSSAHPPPSPLSPPGTMWVCWDQNIFKNIHFLYQLSGYTKTMETSNFLFFILQFVILVSVQGRQETVQYWAGQVDPPRPTCGNLSS